MKDSKVMTTVICTRLYELERYTKELSEDLNRVLSPPVSVGAKPIDDTIGVKSPHCPLILELMGIESKINAIIKYVDDIRTRLEV